MKQKPARAGVLRRISTRAGECAAGCVLRGYSSQGSSPRRRIPAANNGQQRTDVDSIKEREQIG